MLYHANIISTCLDIYTIFSDDSMIPGIRMSEIDYRNDTVIDLYSIPDYISKGFYGYLLEFQ